MVYYPDALGEEGEYIGSFQDILEPGEIGPIPVSVLETLGDNAVRLWADPMGEPGDTYGPVLDYLDF